MIFFKPMCVRMFVCVCVHKIDDFQNVQIGAKRRVQSFHLPILGKKPSGGNRGGGGSCLLLSPGIFFYFFCSYSEEMRALTATLENRDTLGTSLRARRTRPLTCWQRRIQTLRYCWIECGNQFSGCIVWKTMEFFWGASFFAMCLLRKRCHHSFFSLNY